MKASARHARPCPQTLQHKESTMLRIMKYLSKTEIGQLLISLVTIVGQVYFDLELPSYMSEITRLVETPGSQMRDIWISGGKMLLVSFGSLVCAVITGYFAARVAASFGQRLRSLEFRKVESFGPSEMHRFSTASLRRVLLSHLIGMTRLVLVPIYYLNILHIKIQLNLVQTFHLYNCINFLLQVYKYYALHF